MIGKRAVLAVTSCCASCDKPFEPNEAGKASFDGQPISLTWF
jgi:hypothetical protein